MPSSNSNFLVTSQNIVFTQSEDGDSIMLGPTRKLPSKLRVESGLVAGIPVLKVFWETPKNTTKPGFSVGEFFVSLHSKSKTDKPLN